MGLRIIVACADMMETAVLGKDYTLFRPQFIIGGAGKLLPHVGSEAIHR